MIVRGAAGSVTIRNLKVMAAAKNKWYVVWHGHNSGVYDSWEACKAQIHGVPGAKYKAFPSRAEAEAALEESAHLHVGAGTRKPAKPRTFKEGDGPRLPSLSVDAACDMTTGVMEYRGVDTATGVELFRMGPFQDSTNNIGEFLAVVHALGLLKQKGSSVPIYSDSRTALSWLRHKHAKTTVARTAGNADVFELLDRAERWLNTNTWPNVVLKWETERWGENPADFGRK